jgi:hypothetical protein
LLRGLWRTVAAVALVAMVLTGVGVWVASFLGDYGAPAEHRSSMVQGLRIAGLLLAPLLLAAAVAAERATSPGGKDHWVAVSVGVVVMVGWAALALSLLE